ERIRQLQGGNDRDCLRHFSGQIFFWTAHNSIWLCLPRGAVDYSSTGTPKKGRAALADSAHVLPVDQCSWFLVTGHDRLLYRSCGRVLRRAARTDRVRTMGRPRENEAALDMGRQRSFSVPESLRRTAGVLSA